MTIRALFHTAGLATVLVLSGQQARGQTFINNQSAVGLIGRTSFTESNVASNLPNRLSSPNGLAMHPTTGQIFVADRVNNRILRFSGAASAEVGAFPEKVIGQANFTNKQANQGLAAPTAETLSAPCDVFVDSAGRLWVADSGNNRVLRFDHVSALDNNPPASVVLGQANFTTANASCTATTMSQPFGVHVDSDDHLWVADRTNNRVLRFDIVTRKANGAAADLVLGQALFTTNASAAGATGMNQPTDVEIDAGEGLWVADKDNNRVLRFDGATTLATNGSPADRVLGQADFDGIGAGRTAASLDRPFGVYADAGGNLWVADFGNARAIRFNDVTDKASGASADIVLGQEDFTVLKGGVTEKSLNFPVRIAEGPSASVLVEDFNISRVMRFDPIDPPPSLRAPVISLTGPPRRQTTKAKIVITGSSSDPDGTVVTVEGNANKGAFTNAQGASPWRFNVNKLKKGKNLLTIRAVDDDGLTSELVRVTVTRK